MESEAGPPSNGCSFTDAGQHSPATHAGKTMTAVISGRRGVPARLGTV